MNFSQEYSYLIVDETGELLKSQYDLFQNHGYDVKVFNLKDMNNSDYYNPFNYIETNLDVFNIVDCFENAKSAAKRANVDLSLRKYESALLSSLVFYLLKYRPKREHNFTNIMKILSAAIIDVENPNRKTPFDRLMDETSRFDPNNIALMQYDLFRSGSADAANKIIKACYIKLSAFQTKEFGYLTQHDNINLNEMNSKKKAVFVVIPKTDSTFKFVNSTIQRQFSEMYKEMETNDSGNVYSVKIQN